MLFKHTFTCVAKKGSFSILCQMQTRWYVPQGRTLENTKIAERGHVLHINKNEWEKITGHLNRDALVQAALDEEREHRKRMKEGSEEMTKAWPDSIENVRARKEEERMRILDYESNKETSSFYELTRRQEEERKAYCEKISKKMFMKETYPTKLNSALLEAECLFERTKQLELNKVLRQHKMDEEAKWAKIVKEQAAEEVKEKEEEKKKEKEKRIADGQFYINQIKEKEALIKDEHNGRIARELLDAKNMAHEIKALEEYEREDKKKKIRLAAQLHREFEEVQEQQKKADAILEKEIEEIIDIQSKAKHKMDCTLKQKIKDLRQEEIRRREEMCKNLAREQEALEEEEERRLKKAIAEREAAEEEKIRKKKEYQEQLRLETLKDREIYLEKLAVQQYKEKELNKWECINSVKQLETMKKYEEERRQKHEEHMKSYQSELDVMREINKKQADQSKQRGYVLRKKMEEEAEESHKKFFEYADEVMELAKSKGRSTFAIEEVIKTYKKDNNLTIKEEKLCVGGKESRRERKPEKLARDMPGKRAHYPESDPNFRRCKCQKERLYR